MKKIISSILMVVVLSLTLTGCDIPQQLNKMAIVQAIGVDKIGDEYELSFQIYTPEGGRGEIDTSKENSSIVVASGKTIAQAISNATTKQGKTLFVGHNRLLIIGEEAAKDGIEFVFSYFDSNDKTRENAQVMMAKGNAKEIISTNIQQGILSAETIKNIAENTKENGYIFTSAYYLLSKNMYLYNGCGVMAVIEKTSDTQEESSQDTQEASNEITDISIVTVEKTAVFKDYKLVDVLEKDSTRGLCFLSDEIDKTTIVVEEQDFISSISLNDNKSKLWLEDDSGLKLKLEITAKASIEEFTKLGEFEFSEETINKIQDNAAQTIKKECEEAFKKIVQENNSDVLYISNLLLKYNKDKWMQLKENFDEVLSQLELEVEVEIVVDKLGLQVQ